MHPLGDQREIYANSDAAAASLLIRINRRILKQAVDVLLDNLLSFFQI